jgi:hypothetical protein
MRVRAVIYVAHPSDDSDEAVARLVAASKVLDVDPHFLHSGVVKVFADGVMEFPAQTAAMLSPYLDAEGKPTTSVGELYFDPERFARLVTKLDAAGSRCTCMPLETALFARRWMPSPQPEKSMATGATATKSLICSWSTPPTFRASRSSA